MNNKQIACVIVVLLTMGIAWITSTMNTRMIKMQAESSAAQLSADSLSTQLLLERHQLDELGKNSADLIAYLNVWQPYFDAIDSSQNAELKISLRIKEDNLVSLSQRYETASDTKNPSIPFLMRATLSIEDSYSRVLNWLGRTESQLPTLRIMKIKLTRGTDAKDLRVDAVLEQPLLKR